MDIEGGEYAILSDERFTQMNVKQLVMEWHHRTGQVEGRQWCMTRPRGLGYAVNEREQGEGYGTIAAYWIASDKHPFSQEMNTTGRTQGVPVWSG